MSTKRLRWTIDQAQSRATLEGDIDEFAELPQLASQLGGQRVQLDVGGLRRINSLGVRQWIQFVRSLAGKNVALLRCPPPIVEQLSCIKDFRGHALVQSVLLPFVCESCGDVRYTEQELAPLRSTQAIPGGPPCARCGTACVLDDFPERYLQLAEMA